MIAEHCRQYEITPEVSGQCECLTHRWRAARIRPDKRRRDHRFLVGDLPLGRKVGSPEKWPLAQLLPTEQRAHRRGSVGRLRSLIHNLLREWQPAKPGFDLNCLDVSQFAGSPLRNDPALQVAGIASFPRVATPGIALCEFDSFEVVGKLQQSHRALPGIAKPLSLTASRYTVKVLRRSPKSWEIVRLSFILMP